MLECRILITYLPGRVFALGMYDPVSGRHEPLGNNHPLDRIDKIVGDLKASMERAGHRVTYSEQTRRQ